MAITRLILGLHSIENKILVKIKQKRDDKLQEKLSSAHFFATVVKISAFFHFLA